MRAEDYYFTYDSRGNRIFREASTGKKIAMRTIPASILPDVKAKSEEMTRDEILNSMKAYEAQMEKLSEMVANLKVRLDSLAEDAAKDAAKEKAAAKAKKAAEQARKKAEKAKKAAEEKAKKAREWEKTRNFFMDYMKESTGVTILTTNGIHNKEQWHAWLKKGHPDKGGDVSLCQEIMAAGRKRGW